MSNTRVLCHVYYTHVILLFLFYLIEGTENQNFPWQYLLIKHSSFRILTDITCPIHVSLATCHMYSFISLKEWKIKIFSLAIFLIKHSSFQILTDITCPKQVSFATCLIEGMGNHNLFL